MPGEKSYAIHPAVGIARLGNAPADPTDPSTYYLGPEAPYDVPNRGGPYKSGGKIKKQAQRFRIYEFQEGKATREITLLEDDVADISWTVHLANRKAALKIDEPLGSVSRPAVDPPPVFTANGPDAASRYWPATTRNEGVTDRAKLCIDPGPQTVSKAKPQDILQGGITFVASNGAPASKAVSLGSLFSEPDTGRLLVFGGDGTSEGLDADGKFSSLPKLKSWGDNDNWYDNTADGWVTATVTFTDGSTATLSQPEQRAWVLCVAPRYTPVFNQFTSLYDVARSVVTMPTGTVPRPSFARDIYPILRSVSWLGWVSARGSLGHGTTRAGYYLSEDRMRQMSDNDPDPDSDAYKARQGMFARVRNPNVKPSRDGIQKQMPQVSNDITIHEDRAYAIATVTHLQYAMLTKWAAGEFDADGVPTHVPFDQLAVADQPHALDLATLENSAGTPFYPGIESWRIMAAPGLYVGLLRIGNAAPGDLTIGNALPWQADFLDCNDIWWPIQRPNEVQRGGEALQPWVPQAWMPTEDTADYNKMVEGWWRLGFIVSKDDGATYEEVEGSAHGSGP